MIRYATWGLQKQLNEIVFAGSHDAGIDRGGKNVRTQDLDIHDQAVAGVRLFDIRITGAAVDGGSKDVTLKSYHGQGPESKHTYTDNAKAPNKVDVKVKSMLAGEFGMTLSKILDDARRFVTVTQPGEFVILKFDHCSNWSLIARACVERLGSAIYTGGGNINTKALQDLAGKVIVAFSSSGLAALAGQYGPADGIVGIRNLKSGGSYDPQYAGLQYFGKGGTSTAKPFGKIKQNIENQRKLMSKGSHTHPEVMGMMYWTTTGLFESIEKRNEKMWTAPNRKALSKLWSQGLCESIQERMGAAVNHGSAYARGGVLKAFMPNFVMIDFASDDKCRTIHDLNRVAAVDLADVATVLDL